MTAEAPLAAPPPAAAPVSGGLLRRFSRSERGVAGIEFALVLPIMLLFYLGTVELTQAIAIKRKVTLVSRTLADLTSQRADVTDTEIANIFTAAGLVIDPYGASSMKLRITSIGMNETGSTAKAVWSETPDGLGTFARCQDVTYLLPEAIRRPSTTVIFAEATYQYQPLRLFDRVVDIFWGGTRGLWTAEPGSVALNEVTTMVPRTVNSVARRKAGGPPAGLTTCP